MSVAGILTLARADFRERSRRASFMMMLLFAAWLGFEVSDGHIALRLGSLRGVYNSAWIGTLNAMVVNGFLSLAGFYLVKGAIREDLDSGVGQILAATPLSNLRYMAAKTLSSLGVLYGMVAVVTLFGVALQLLRGESQEFDIWAYIAPVVFLCLPAMSVTAALAMLFDAVRALRGGLGNLVYMFVVWPALMSPALIAQAPVGDLWGLSPVRESIRAAAERVFPNVGDAFSLSAGPRRQFDTFVWDGLHWSSELLLQRVLWLGLALVLVAVAALLFRRFDEPRSGGGESVDQPATDVLASANEPELGSGGHGPRTVGTDAWSPSLSRLGAKERSFSLFALVRAELRLLLRGHGSWWAAGVVVCNGALLFTAGEARSILLAVVWVWPLLIWSGLGARDRRHGTEELLLSTPGPVRRQLVAVWLSGLAFTVVATSGQVLGAFVGGDSTAMALWGAAALAVPSVALAFGLWSGSSKLFEVVYLLIWYTGPLNGMAALDYVGRLPTTGYGHAQVVVVVGIAALAACVVARLRRLAVA